MLEQEKDWMGLPPELIQIIAKKLPDLPDFIRFRATCKAWRSSAPLSDHPPQLPWFLELAEGEDDDNCTWKTQRFYSLSSCQTLTIRLTQSMSQLWFVKGAFSHYLPFEDFCEDTLSFFNPLTKDQFSLPLKPSEPGLNETWMVWTGTDPIRNRSIVVVDMNRWACYDPHSNKWVEQRGFFVNNCYWQGMFFSTHVASVTEVFDTSSKKLLHNIPPPEDELTKTDEFYNNNNCSPRESYLVESLGTILRVSWFYDFRGECILEDSICDIHDIRGECILEDSIYDIGDIRGECILEDSIYDIHGLKFDIHNLEFDKHRLEFDGLDGQPCWVRVHNIGNQILFLNEKAGFSMTARPSTGFREGCIYFINPFYYKPYVYDILAGTVERIPCPFERCTWFLPGL